MICYIYHLISAFFCDSKSLNALSAAMMQSTVAPGCKSGTVLLHVPAYITAFRDEGFDVSWPA